MRKKIKELSDFAILNPQFFTTLKSLNSCFEDFTAMTMGMGYYAHSADKYVTKIVQELYDNEDITTEQARGYIANIVTAKYGDNWKRLEEAMIETVYDPVENYLMRERNITDVTTTTFGKKVDDDDSITFGKRVDDDDSITFGKRVDDDDTTTFGKRISDDTDTTYGKRTEIDDDHTETKNGKEKDTHSITEDDVTTTPGVTTTVEGDVYGYNSSTAVPNDKRVERKSGHDTQAHTLEETNEISFTNRNDVYDGTIINSESGTDAVERDYQESGTETNAKDYQESGTETHAKDYHESGTETHAKDYQESGTEEVEHEYEFERRGNIGVTTSQQMLESEIELRKFSFLEMVYNDIDKVLTLQTY